jgi:pimeloyl-ACP methyl ester carboxylesterase
VDILGEANPSRPTHQIASLDDFTACFSELLDGLAIDTADVVGNSFGGFLAVGAAMRIPRRIRSLVLIGPAATFHPIRPFYTHVFLPKAVNLMAPWIPGHAHRTRRSLNWLHAGLPQDSHWAPLFYQVMLHGSVTNRLFPRVFTAQELSVIAGIPVLLLIGDRERIYRPQEAALAARRLLPGANIEIIPNAHHIAALANPAAVNESVRNFLSQLPKKSP